MCLQVEKIHVNKLQQDFNLVYITMWQLPLHYSFPVIFSFQSEVIILMTVRAASAAASAAARHVLVLCCTSHLCPHWNSPGGLRCGSFLTPFNSSFSLRCNSGGDLCPLEKGANLWVLPLAVLSFAKWRIVIIPIKFHMQYCISAFVGWTMPWCDWSLPKAATNSVAHFCLSHWSVIPWRKSQIFILGHIWIVLTFILATAGREIEKSPWFLQHLDVNSARGGARQEAPCLWWLIV